MSGGGADFMRVWSEKVYGIPPENVVGSTGRTVFEFRDGRPELAVRLDCAAVTSDVPTNSAPLHANMVKAYRHSEYVVVFVNPARDA